MTNKIEVMSPNTKVWIGIVVVIVVIGVFKEVGAGLLGVGAIVYQFGAIDK